MSLSGILSGNKKLKRHIIKKKNNWIYDFPSIIPTCSKKKEFYGNLILG